jgi:hypothetical protein
VIKIAKLIDRSSAHVRGGREGAAEGGWPQEAGAGLRSFIEEVYSFRVMSWTVEYTDEFSAWWDDLSEPEQDSVAATVGLLEQDGPHLKFPHSSDIKGARHGQLRELRVQHDGKPFRVFYAFDPRRAAILLIGGNKTGDDRFYERMVPLADSILAGFLRELKVEEAVPVDDLTHAGEKRSKKKRKKEK